MLKAQLEKKIKSLESEVKRLEEKANKTSLKSKTVGGSNNEKPPTETRIIKFIYDIEIRSINFDEIGYFDWEKIDKLSKLCGRKR